MRTETSKLEKKMEERHNVVTNLDTVQSKKDSEFVMEGYLFKRTSNAFKTWNRRWFYLCDNQLVYRCVKYKHNLYLYKLIVQILFTLFLLFDDTSVYVVT